MCLSYNFNSINKCADHYCAVDLQKLVLHMQKAGLAHDWAQLSRLIDMYVLKIHYGLGHCWTVFTI